MDFSFVLIETLWNVNVLSWLFLLMNNAVLIETLWNVNLNLKLRGHWILCINRNIVECKYILPGSHFEFMTRINRNIVECK